MQNAKTNYNYYCKENMLIYIYDKIFKYICSIFRMIFLSKVSPISLTREQQQNNLIMNILKKSVELYVRLNPEHLDENN